MKGKRVAIVFVSVKNNSCRKVIRDLKASLASAPQGSLKAVLVHDASVDPEEIRRYLAWERVDIPLGRVRQDRSLGWHSPAFVAYRATSVPTIVLIGPDGKVLEGTVPLDRLGTTLGGDRVP